MSPLRGGPKIGSAGRPVTSAIASRSSSRLNRVPQATLQVSGDGRGSDARRLAETTLSMYVKSREISPVPLTVGRWPARAAVTNLGTTAAYSESGPGPARRR